jgi:hypothetical protein
MFAEEACITWWTGLAGFCRQLGGNIGTNAGGIKVIRYGMTRNCGRAESGHWHRRASELNKDLTERHRL